MAREYSELVRAALSASLPHLTAEAPLSAEGAARGGVVTVRVDALLESSRVSAQVRTLRGGGKTADVELRLQLSWSMFWLGGASGASAAPGAACGGGELRTADAGADDFEEEFPVTAVVLRAPRAATPAFAEVVTAARDLAGGALAGLLRAALRKLPGWLLALDSTPEAEAEAAEQERARRAAAEARHAQAAAVLGPQRVADAGGATAAAAAGAAAAAAAAAVAADAAAAAAPPPPPPVPSARAAPLLAAADAMVASAGSGGAAVALPVAAHRVTPAGEAPEVRASKWNTGGWGYEEKDVTPWAVAHLKALLNGFHVDIPGGHVKVVEVETVKGEAAKILRKGGTIVVFDLSFVASWEGALVDPVTGAQKGVGDGVVEVTDLDQDAFSVKAECGGGGGGGDGGYLELPFRIRASQDGGAVDRELARLLEEFGAPLLRARLARFCAELKAQEVDGLHV